MAAMDSELRPILWLPHGNAVEFFDKLNGQWIGALVIKERWNRTVYTGRLVYFHIPLFDDDIGHKEILPRGNNKSSPEQILKALKIRWPEHNWDGVEV